MKEKITEKLRKKAETKRRKIEKKFYPYREPLKELEEEINRMGVEEFKRKYGYLSLNLLWQTLSEEIENPISYIGFYKRVKKEFPLIFEVFSATKGKQKIKSLLD